MHTYGSAVTYTINVTLQHDQLATLVTSNPTITVVPFFQDDFNRSDSSTLGATWINQVGALAVAGNQAITTGNGVNLSTRQWPVTGRVSR